MKKTILFLTIIFFSFLAGKCVFAHATVLTDVIQNSSSGQNGGHDNWQGQSFKAGHNNIAGFSTYSNNGSDNPLTFNAYFCAGEPDYFNIAGHPCAISGNLDQVPLWQAIATTTNNGYIYMFFDNPVSTTVGNTYFFTIDTNTKTFYFPLVNGAYDVYPDGHCFFTDSNCGIADSLFTTYYSDAYVPPSKLITAISPLSSQQFVSASTSVDFTFQYNRTDTPDALAFLGIEDMNNGTLYTLWPELTELTGEKTSHVNLPNGTYGWSVVLFDRTNLPFVQLASTTPEYFAVLAQKQTENICAGIQTTTGITDFHLWGDLVCGTKTFSLWAFTPTQTSLDNFSDRFDDFKDSFPFNAFFDLTDTVSGAIATSSTESMAGTVKVPFITATGTFIMLPVLASSSLPNLIGSTNAKLIRDSITWFLWLGAGVLVFLTFKKI